MSDGIGWLIGIFIVAFVVAAIVATIATIGLLVFAACAAYGFVSGAGIAIFNFGKTVKAARATVPRLPPPPATPPKRAPWFLPQPAYKLYPFDRAWREITFIRKHIFLDAGNEAKVWLRRAANTQATLPSMTQTYIRFWTWCLIAGQYFAGGSQYLSAMVVAALFLAIQSLVLGIWAGIVMTGIGILQGSNFIYSRWHRIFRRCPACHEEMSIPVFICPTCGAKHDRLWPSIYGVFAHLCANCVSTTPTRLPTVEWMGRSQLYRICPVCAHPQPQAIGGAKPYHIALIGGPSTGKTNLMVTATRDLIARHGPARGYALTFADQAQQAEFENNILRGLDQGKPLAKTSAEIPQAINLEIRQMSGRHVRKLAYIYDAAGEIYGGQSRKATQQAYYNYIDGLIFVIDPFAIPLLQARLGGDIARVGAALQPSNADIEDAFNRMVETIERFSAVKPGAQFPYPLAVVVSKVDALGLEAHIGQPAAQEFLASNPSLGSEDEAINVLVRRFLESQNLGKLLTKIDARFKVVRYFAVSSLGRLPSPQDTRSFAPLRADQPFLWIFEKIRIFAPTHGNAVAASAPKPLPVSVGSNV